MSVVFNAEGPFDSVSALRTGTSTPFLCAQDRGPFDGAQDRPFDGAQDRPLLRTGPSTPGLRTGPSTGLRTGPSTGLRRPFRGDRPFDGAQDRPFDGAQDRLACWGRGKIIGPGKENRDPVSSAPGHCRLSDAVVDFILALGRRGSDWRATNCDSLPNIGL